MGPLQFRDDDGLGNSPVSRKNPLPVRLTAGDAVAVTPDDDADLIASALYVGGAGDVTVTTAAGTLVTFVGVPVGTILPVSVSKVMATDTDATDIVALA